MNNTSVVFFILLSINSTVIGMKMQQPHYLKIIPSEIEQKITASTGWWYLDKTFIHNNGVRSLCIDSSEKLLATTSYNKQIYLFDIPSAKKLTSFFLITI